MKICVYAIAKNESRFVERWMASMSGADYICVLDTGSTDDTVEKLRKLGATVAVKDYGSEFRFDVARNDSMKLIPPDTAICVCTDIDEFFRERDWADRLRKAWGEAIGRGESPTTGYYDYIWNFDANGKPLSQFTYEKIHAPKACVWTHPVHEILDYDVRKVGVKVPILLEHHADDTKSRGQYLGLLELSVREQPDNDRNVHYLGREYMFHRQWDKAVETLKRHLELPSAVWKPERAQSMRYIANCYASMCKFDEAELWYFRAIAEAPEQRESACDLAVMSYSLKRWEICKLACELALRVQERDGNYCSELENWGAKPWDLYSIALWNLGDRANALVACRMACDLDPKDGRLLENLKVMEKQINGET